MRFVSFDIWAVDNAETLMRRGKRGLGASGNRARSLLHKRSYSRLLGIVALWVPKSFAAVPNFLSLGSGAVL